MVGCSLTNPTEQASLTKDSEVTTLTSPVKVDGNTVVSNNSASAGKKASVLSAKTLSLSGIRIKKRICTTAANAKRVKRKGKISTVVCKHQTV